MESSPKMCVPEGVDFSEGRHCRIAPTTILKGRGRLVVDDYVTIEDHVMIDLGSSAAGEVYLRSRSKIKIGGVLRCYNGQISVGHRTTIGEYTVVAGHGGVHIGAHVGIASHCSLTASNHLFGDHEAPFRYRGETAAGIVVEDDVWIAAGVRILDGVSIGTGSVIGAGAVVSRPMPQHMVCVGIPCRPVRSTHPNQTKP